MPPRPDRRTRTLDSLRLVALGRIPRCSGCARFHALVAAHDGGEVLSALPAVPARCRHEVCAPLAARYALDPQAAPPQRVAGAIDLPYAS
jgi:hypothetical protein